jgi:hypothetical protein
MNESRAASLKTIAWLTVIAVLSGATIYLIKVLFEHLGIGG